jgi:hypothetical protein
MMMTKKTGKPVDILTVGRFAEVNDSTFAEYGVKRGQVVYLAGDYTVPFKESNPYLLQKLFIAGWVDEDGHVVEAGVDENKPFVINPKRLKHLSKPHEERLTKIYDEDFRDKQDEMPD